MLIWRPSFSVSPCLCLSQFLNACLCLSLSEVLFVFIFLSSFLLLVFIGSVWFSLAQTHRLFSGGAQLCCWPKSCRAVCFLYEPSLTKEAADLQWRVLHRIVAASAFLSVINQGLSDKCPPCSDRQWSVCAATTVHVVGEFLQKDRGGFFQQEEENWWSGRHWSVQRDVGLGWCVDHCQRKPTYFFCGVDVSYRFCIYFIQSFIYVFQGWLYFSKQLVE